MTKDRDYLQLANEHARIWMVQTSDEKAEHLYREFYYPYGCIKKMLNLPVMVFEYSEDHVKALEGVYPEYIPDLKGIVGDISVNISDVKGVASAEAPLLNEYHKMEIYIMKLSHATKNSCRNSKNFGKNH